MKMDGVFLKPKLKFKQQFRKKKNRINERRKRKLLINNTSEWEIEYFKKNRINKRNIKQPIVNEIPKQEIINFFVHSRDRQLGKRTVTLLKLIPDNETCKDEIITIKLIPMIKTCGEIPSYEIENLNRESKIFRKYKESTRRRRKPDRFTYKNK